MKINIIKCPQCNSTNKSPITDNFFHCNQCGSNYYGDKNPRDGLIVSSGKSSITNKINKPTMRVNKKSLLPVIVIGMLIVYYAIPFIKEIVTNKDDTYIIDESMSDTVGLSTQQEDEPSIVNITSTQSDSKSYPRTAYVLYQDSAIQQAFLFKANFLTQNIDPDDSKTIIIKKENGSFVGYDALNNKVIPNFKQLASAPFSFDAAILYSDKDSLIVKNRISNSYQLEMLDPYTGNVIWTLSDKELAGIDKLNGKFLSETNEGIELFRNNFRIKLPPNYYVVDKKGQIIGFGKIN